MCSLDEAYAPPSFGKKKKWGLLPMKESKQSDFDKYKSYAPALEENSKNLIERFGNENATSNGMYRARGEDMKYYCENYGIACNNKVVEKFQNAPTNDKLGKIQTSCDGPLQAPMYEIPLTEESKAQYNKAMSIALEQEEMPTATAPPERPYRSINMNNVSGYYDEDLESYLQKQDDPMSSVNMPPRENNQTPIIENKEIYKTTGISKPSDPNKNIPKESAKDFTNKVEHLTNITPYNPKTPAKQTYVSNPETVNNDYMRYTFEIILFVLGGILIILLCEQLFKIGIMMGMRQTVDTLRPYLD